MKIGIAGAGIMGRLLALAFYRAGANVTVFDEKSAMNCSMAAAGLLTPISELEKNPEIIYRLGTEAFDSLWPELVAELAIPHALHREGCLVVSHPQDRAELQRFASLIATKKVAATNLVDKNQILELEPQITKFNQAYYFSQEGYLDCQLVMQALEKYLQITWKHQHVTHVHPYEIHTNDNIFHFDLVFDCRGLGAKQHFSDLRAVRGELLWSHAPEVEIRRPIRLMHPRYKLYIVPRPYHRYLVGASEIESADYSEISVRSALELLTAVYSIHSGFAEARILKSITHCRPTLSTHLPKIKYTDGLIAINGLYRHGYLIAPTLMSEVMRGKQGIENVRYPELWEKIA